MKLFIATGLPVRLVDNEAFQDFCRTLDPKFSVPGMFNSDVGPSHMGK